MVTFTIITGDEKYKVIDLVTGGESFFEDKREAYQMMAVLKNKLNHNYRLEIRDGNNHEQPSRQNSQTP